MLLYVTNGTQPVLSNYIIHLFINAQSKNRLALTFQTWLQQRPSFLSKQQAEGGKRMVGGLGLIRNPSKHPREQHFSLLGYRYYNLSGKVGKNQVTWIVQQNWAAAVAAWVMLLILCYTARAFWLRWRHSMSSSPRPAEVRAIYTDPKLKAILRRGLKSGDRSVTDMWLQPSWCWGYMELPCQAQALPKLLTLGLIPHSCWWLLASAVALWHLHSSFRHKLMGLVGPRLDFHKVIINISASVSKLLSTKRNKKCRSGMQ